jgi:hypothetical protein
MWQQAGNHSDAMELELRRLNRWSAALLPESAFENMGVPVDSTLTNQPIAHRPVSAEYGGGHSQIGITCRN